jgi:hypothetical protein
MGIQFNSKFARVATSAFCISALYACGGGSGDSTPLASIPPANTQPVLPLAPTLGAAVVLEDGTAVGAATFQKGDTASGGQGQLVQNLSCTKPAKVSAAYTYTHLNLVVDGQQVAIPENIGLVTQGNLGIADAALREIGCEYPMQTTDSSGKIRIQPGSAAPYTLGQFFAVWGQPLTSANVAGYTGKPIKVYTKDGTVLTEYTGSLDALPLTANREITIQVGTALAQVPNFEWINPPPLSATVVAVKRGSSGLADGQPGLEDNLFNNKGGQGNAVAGLSCYGPRNQNEFKEIYHLHTHLAIFKDGVRLAIPSFIGIVGNDTVPNTFCAYPLHTHDSNGTIHVEPPDTNPVTLGQFFAIWGQPLLRTNVAGQAGQPVVAYIKDGGGNVRKFQGDLATIDLKSQRSIVIQIGTPLTEIPAYDLVDELQ